jgi:DNA gyrase subunit A
VRDLEEEGKHVFFATRNGTVKKTPLKDFSNVMSRGIIAIGIDEDDELVAASVTDGNQIIFLASHEGQAIRFDEEDVRHMGRPAYGVRGMDLDKGDYLVGMAVTPKPGMAPVAKSIAKKVEEVVEGAPETTAVKAKTDGKDKTAADKKQPPAKAAPPKEEVAEHPSMILSVTENGYGKRTLVDEYRLQSRGGKGVINIKTTDRNGTVVGIKQANNDDELMLMTEKGITIRLPVKDVSIIGRNAQGVRLVRLEEGDKLAAIATVVKDDVIAEEGQSPEKPK